MTSGHGQDDHASSSGEPPLEDVAGGKAVEPDAPAVLPQPGRSRLPAVTGRIRRLLAMADKKADAEGLPGTESAVPAGIED